MFTLTNFPSPLAVADREELVGPYSKNTKSPNAFGFLYPNTPRYGTHRGVHGPWPTSSIDRLD
jgi:hypothetical protein